jgi:D-serine deaminase-like pyridoxal phosphate-dependent protein
VTLRDLPTPRVVVDFPRLQRNIANMAALAKNANVALRPHAKTHKSPVVARWQIEAGAIGVCCAKIGEAEVFVEAGIENIRVPYPVHPSNADRVLRLIDRADISIIVDDESVARGWAERIHRADRELDVLVKVDVGFHRCGVDPSAPDVVERIVRIADLRGLHFRGLLSHAGHSYLAGSTDDIKRIAITEIELLGNLADQLRTRGVGVDEISVGSTPSARFIALQPGATEMRPGNYVFFDRTQVGLGSATFDECAMSIIATVVSHPAADRLILDCGAKTLAIDGARGFGAFAGYGAIFPSLDATSPDPSLVIERLSEEHATVRVTGRSPLKIGDRVRVYPNHACVVTNLMDELLLVDGDTVIDHLPVAARGRIW